MLEIRGPVELPAKKEEIELHTEDGLTLVGELATPEQNPPVAVLLTMHPLPTAGGFMDSHIYRKAAARLPALADLAVLRFNTRGTSSPRGTSQGSFDGGQAEGYDLKAAYEFLKARGFENIWVVGWSFGTEVTLKHAADLDITGAILLSPPLKRTSEAELLNWNLHPEKKIVAIVPEFDDYLRPTEAAQRFAGLDNFELIAVENGKHLWVGESQSYRILSEIVRLTNPDKLPLPTQWQ